jgi:hypothetical protein
VSVETPQAGVLTQETATAWGALQYLSIPGAGQAVSRLARDVRGTLGLDDKWEFGRQRQDGDMLLTVMKDPETFRRMNGHSDLTAIHQGHGGLHWCDYAGRIGSGSPPGIAAGQSAGAHGLSRSVALKPDARPVEVLSVRLRRSRIQMGQDRQVTHRAQLPHPQMIRHPEDSRGRQMVWKARIRRLAEIPAPRYRHAHLRVSPPSTA